MSVIALWIALIALLLAPLYAAAGCGAGCSAVGAIFGVDETPDVYLLIGDVQHNDYCVRWEGSETECADKIIERLQQTYTAGMALISGEPDAIITLGDQTESALVGERQQFRDDFVEWMPAWAQAKFRWVTGNHDVSSSCGKLRQFLDDPWLQVETTGAVPTETYWVVEGKHSRVLGIPTLLIGDFYTQCITPLTPFCYGDTDSGDACTVDSDCLYKCYEGERHYAEFTAWYSRQMDLNAEAPNVKMEITAGHQALCNDNTCATVSAFHQVENLLSCDDPPDVGEPCGGGLACPSAGPCTTDRVGYETKDFFMAEHLDREALNVWTNGHFGGCPAADCDDVPYTDMIGTTDLLTVILSGPWQSGNDDNRKQGAVLKAYHDGTFDLDYIVIPSAAPTITSPASFTGISAGVPTDITLTGTDPDFSSIYWTITPSDVCITESPNDTCCVGGLPLTSCCGDTSAVGSLSPVLEVDCPAATYTIDVELNDGLAANTQFQTVTVTVE